MTSVENLYMDRYTEPRSLSYVDIGASSVSDILDNIYADVRGSGKVTN